MILVRNVFQMKFGQAKEAIALWKEGLALNSKLGMSQGGGRLLTDLAGPSFYTIVVEFEFESLAEYEQKTSTALAKPEWQAWYAKMQPFLAGGHREIFTIVR